MDWLLYENKYYEKYSNSNEEILVCGVDEAGRGPLAGDVYAAAVVMPRGLILDGVNDSKKMTSKKRDKMFDLIIEKCVGYGVGIASNEEIDEINILRATHVAMTRAIENLEQKLNKKVNVILIDGNSAPDIKDENKEIECVIKGDSLSHSIACASIIAKVSRDRYMIEQSKIYPEYSFEKHKGYGTKLHIDMIKKYNMCKIHRKSFLNKILSKI